MHRHSQMGDDLPVGAADRGGDERPERSEQLEGAHGTQSIVEFST